MRHVISLALYRARLARWRLLRLKGLKIHPCQDMPEWSELRGKFRVITPWLGEMTSDGRRWFDAFKGLKGGCVPRFQFNSRILSAFAPYSSPSHIL